MPVSIPPGTSLADLMRLSEGCRVMARWRGTGPWFPGHVASVTHSGTTPVYSIHYDDGDRDEGIRGDAVRPQLPHEAAAAASAPPPPVVLVAAPARVAETRTLAALGLTLDVGARVIARWRSRGGWFPGTVSQVDGDGTQRRYRIAYDDGTVDTALDSACVGPLEGVPLGVVLLPGSGSAAAVAPPVDDPASAAALGVTLAPGARITARYRGGQRWFPGTISGVVGEGTAALYDVSYEDGDQERGVRAGLVMPLPGGGAAVAGDCSPLVGALVEARFRGLGRYFPGRVTRVAGHGTAAVLDILYDDGDREAGVPVALVRLRGGGAVVVPADDGVAPADVGT